MSWISELLGHNVQLFLKDQEIAKRDSTIHALIENQDTLYGMLQDKDIEIQRLTDLMLTEHGVIQHETRTTTVQAKPQPIGRRSSFKTIRDKYEAADRKMAQDIAKDQVDKLTNYWTKKDHLAGKENAS